MQRVVRRSILSTTPSFSFTITRPVVTRNLTTQTILPATIYPKHTSSSYTYTSIRSYSDNNNLKSTSKTISKKMAEAQNPQGGAKPMEGVESTSGGAKLIDGNVIAK